MPTYHTKDELQKLRGAVEHHFVQLKSMRDKREEFLESAAGTLYPHTSAINPEFQDILGLMRQASESLALSMSAQQPQIIATAQTVDRLKFADHFERTINTYAKTMHMGEVLNGCVRDAFFMMGVAKVHMADSVSVQLESNEWMDPGKPFMGRVSPVHLCYDTYATEWQNCEFISDRYRVRWKEVVNDTKFPSDVRKQLREQGPEGVGHLTETEWGSPMGGASSDTGEFQEHIYLADIFLPKDGVIYTWPVNAAYQFTTEKPIFSKEYGGSETGPYFFLNLGQVPDKTTPSSPAQNLLLLHNLINTIYRKLAEQCERQKQFTISRKGSEDDAVSMRDIEDGGNLTLMEPEGFKRESVDGPNQQNFGFVLNALQQFSKQAGNLESKLGLGAQADTAAQEGMIAQGVAGMEAMYQQKFADFTVKCVRELGKLLYDDNVTEIPMMMDVEGTDYKVDDPWKGAGEEGARDGEYYDYDIDIDPQSMKYRSSRERLQELDETWDRLMPLAPLMMQQGIMPNIKEYLDIRSKYTSTPEMKRLFLFDQQPPQQEQQGGGHERMLPPGQSGPYEHVSRGSGGSAGTEQEAIGQMMASTQGQSDAN